MPARKGKHRWKTLKEAKGYQDSKRIQLPSEKHLNSFLRALPLARKIPNPVATPLLPPQQKIAEIRKWLWWHATQRFPSASVLSRRTVAYSELRMLYGLVSMNAKGQVDFPMAKAAVNSECTTEQIDQFFARAITHCFKTWRQMRSLHTECVRRGGNEIPFSDEEMQVCNFLDEDSHVQG